MLLKIDTSQAHTKICSKCRKEKPVFRHHMGNDAWLANFNRRIRRNYYKYLDCVALCNHCHMVIHYIYELRVNRSYGGMDLSSAGASRLRLQYIFVCQTWLSGQIENPAVPQVFKDQWQRSFKGWREANRQQRKSKKKFTKDA